MKTPEQKEQIRQLTAALAATKHQEAAFSNKEAACTKVLEETMLRNQEEDRRTAEWTTEELEKRQENR